MCRDRKGALLMSKAEHPVLAVVLAAAILPIPGGLSAAELVAPVGAAAPAPQHCGPCGCLSVSYVHHRELRSTYGLAFDPRNFDQTQPYYYFGSMRAYPRFYVDGVPVGAARCELLSHW